MPSNSRDLSNKYASHLNNLDYTRNKMEKLYNRGDIVSRDINLVYEGLYLDVVAYLEGLIEKLFIGLLSGSIIHISKVVPKVKFNSYHTARDVVLGGKKYLQWFPYGYTEERANAFFRNGFPFSSFERTHKKSIEEILYIRNAIAHKSKYSMTKFELEVIGSQKLMPRERTPAGYLRSVFRSHPPQTRYEELAGRIAGLVNKLCS